MSLGGGCDGLRYVISSLGDPCYINELAVLRGISLQLFESEDHAKKQP